MLNLSSSVYPVAGCAQAKKLIPNRKQVQAQASVPTHGEANASGFSSKDPMRKVPHLPETDSRPTVFGNIENILQDRMERVGSAPGSRRGWQEVEGCWVLRPPARVGAPQAVVHFIGAAFVGAAPQISYRLFLECLAQRNIMVIATPYQTSFDNLRATDEIHYSMERCLQQLGTEVAGLPIYGVGHSLGSTLHLLLATRYAAQRSGNVLLSFSNREATSVVPFLSPIIAPGAQMLGPILARLANSPVRNVLEQTAEALKGVSPTVVKQVLPMVEQLIPLYMDVSMGRSEFQPTPDEVRNLVTAYYSTPRNLLLRFKSDPIDQSNQLATLFQGQASVASQLDLTVRTLPGDHLRPNRQAFLDVPAPLSRAASQAALASGKGFENAATALEDAGQDNLTKGLRTAARRAHDVADVIGEDSGPVITNMQELADEIAAWIGVGNVVVMGSKALPASKAVRRALSPPSRSGERIKAREVKNQSRVTKNEQPGVVNNVDKSKQLKDRSID